MESRYTKSFYKIGEASEIIGVPPTTIRYWEKEFPEIKPKRSDGNRRYFTPSDLETLEIIHFLLHIKGLKIEAAKEQLRHNKKNISKKIKIIEKLETVRDDLENLLKSLNLREQKWDFTSNNAVVK